VTRRPPGKKYVRLVGGPADGQIATVYRSSKWVTAFVNGNAEPLEVFKALILQDQLDATAHLYREDAAEPTRFRYEGCRPACS
jgi:hypothetical protein